MPLLTLRTNATLADPADLARTLSAVMAELLGKPERFVMIDIQGDAAMLFGGSDAPCAMLRVESIGLEADATADLSAALCHAMGHLLDLPADRVYIAFAGPDGAMWGWNRQTFG